MRARYGASPVHLLAHLALLPLAAWALLQVLDLRAASNVVLWLVAAVVLHDLLLLPAYSALDRVGRAATRGAINYVRVPLGLSLLMLLVFWGTISGKGNGAFRRVSGSSTRATSRAGCSSARRCSPFRARSTSCAAGGPDARLARPR